MTQAISEDEFQAKLEEAKASAKTYGEIAGLPSRQDDDDLKRLEWQIEQAKERLDWLLQRREKLLVIRRAQKVVCFRRDLEWSFDQIAELLDITPKSARRIFEEELYRERRVQSHIQDGYELYGLDLPVRVHNALRRGGVVTIQQAREYLSAPQAFEVRNMGIAGQAHLRQALKEHDEVHRGPDND